MVLIAKATKTVAKVSFPIPCASVAMLQMTCMNGTFSTIIMPKAIGNEEDSDITIWQITVDIRNI